MSSLPGQSPPFSDFSPGTILKPISRLRPPMPRFEAIVPFPPGIICLGCVESDPRFLYERTKPGPLETAYSENSPAPSHQAGSNLQNAVTPRRISNFHTSTCPTPQAHSNFAKRRHTPQNQQLPYLNLPHPQAHSNFAKRRHIPQNQQRTQFSRPRRPVCRNEPNSPAPHPRPSPQFQIHPSETRSPGYNVCLLH
jgi:hypothetical protein